MSGMFFVAAENAANGSAGGAAGDDEDVSASGAPCSAGEANGFIICWPAWNSPARKSVGSVVGFAMWHSSSYRAHRHADSMQLDVRLGPPRQHGCDGLQRNLDRSVEREFMHLVQRHVHQPREIALDHQAAADQ